MLVHNMAGLFRRWRRFMLINTGLLVVYATFIAASLLNPTTAQHQGFFLALIPAAIGFCFHLAVAVRLNSGTVRPAVSTSLVVYGWTMTWLGLLLVAAASGLFS